MESLIKVQNQNGNLVVSSREVAKNFDKRHNDVVNTIANKMKNLTTNNIVVEDYFIESVFMHKGNTYDKYLLTRDGFSFIVMGFTGEKADVWKLKYIEAFNQMENQIKKQKVLSPMEQLKLQYEVLGDHDNRLQVLEDTMTINYRQQQDLQNKVKSIAVTVLRGLNSNAYKDNSIRGKVFSSIWRDYKDYMGVGSYKDTPRKKIQKGMEFLENWQPVGKLLREIEDTNSQLKVG